MKSVYQSIKSIINERLGAAGSAQVDANKPKPKLTPMQTAVTNVRNQNLPKPAATDKPQAAMVPTKKVAVNKPAQSTTAPAPSQDKLNATQRSAEKSGPDTDAMKKSIAATPAAAPKVEPKVAEPKAAEPKAAEPKVAEPKAAEPAEVPDSVEVTNKEASATKPNDSGGMRGNFSTVKGSSDSGEPSKPSGSPMAGVKSNTADKPQAAMAATPSSERQDVKDSSGNAVKSGSGGTVKTRSADEIGDTDLRTGKVTPGSFEKKQQQGQENLKKLKGLFGMKESTINKKFNITDALYQSVMEVMKKDKKEGSVPRTPEEEKLAAFHGDPKRITHGDVLKARGVTKEEAEPVEEMSSKMKMKLGLYGKKKKTNEESVEEGMMSSAKSVAKKVLSKLGGGSDEDQRKDLQRKMGVPQTGKKPMKEGKDTPGNSYEHQCAIHVKSESFGEGRTITTQHADPDADGNIAWYDVMFEHGIEKQVPTSTLEILVSEMHGHSKKKKM